jgi:hypothetical protein
MPDTHDPASTPARPGVIFLTTREFFWVTISVWLGGIFVLTLLPYLLAPRIGGAFAIAASYFVFFVAWQPIQSITQRALGMKAGVVRLIVFVAGAATIASFLRQALPSLAGQ